MIKPIIRVSGFAEAKARLDEGGAERAMRSTLTLLAHKLGQAQEDTLKKTFKRVGKYTLRSLFAYGPQKGKSLDKMNAVVGSKSPYLTNLEDGFSPQAMAYATDVEGKTKRLSGRFIASQTSRASDGTVLGKYRLGKLSNTFMLRVAGSEVLFARRGGKLIRLRVIKQNVADVKAYRWLDKSVMGVYNKGWVADTFAKMLASGEGWELG